MSSSIAAQAAQQLSQARRDRKKIDALPPELAPQDRAATYAIQDALMQLEGPEIGGWKVAAGTGPEPFCSPIPARDFHKSGASIDLEGTMTRLVEVEVAARIGRDLPPRATPYTRADIVAAIAALHPAIEVIGSRFTDPAAVPQLTGIADFQHNVAVLTGEGRTDWQAMALDKLLITLTIGGVEVGRTETGPTLDAALEALVWLANHSAGRNGGLKAGQVIITGSRVVKPSGKKGDLVIAEVAGLGQVTCTLA